MTQAKYPTERRAELLRTLAAEGRIEVALAADRLGVTTETVRKDLTALESQGRLRRIHGGAVPVEKLNFEPDLSSRTAMSEEKTRIAKAALDYLPSSGSVLLDAGTTTQALADAIGPDTHLRFYSNSVPVAFSLLKVPGVEVDLLGGTLRRTTVAAVGERICRMLDEINVDVVFLGTNGLSAARGLTTPNPEEAAVKRRMLATAETRILLTDHSKFGLVRGIRHAELRDIDIVITDSGTTAKQCEMIRAAGPEIVLV
ncbi:DeoR/GlpR family DNA-binding transcription regulator [Corynebacterium mendelii]|uniref:Lactose phosphotransferase system repressor n=1 Tax=Corynebacterium mendelii TaxID=2765362 RepID=A0A939E471_9CORY|nr:DeoR/GlpR family DNA-binding transcription regulator [Corynebacterium mendelii]MBN9645107.1 DeoR/GlpR transcriptional regulator [Corynebacterium mendelii]